SPGTATAAARSPAPGSPTTPDAAGTVESPVPGDGHAGFGERSGETGQEQSRYRAPDRLNRVDSDVALLRMPGLVMIRAVFRGAAFPPLTCSAACPVLRLGTCSGGAAAGAVAGGDRVGAGQAAAAGGPQAAWNRFIHSCSRCQLSGRCTVMW